MEPDANLVYLRALARGSGGALLFAFPLLMTMEMWELGFAMERGRLLTLFLVSLPVLLGLSYFAGFENTFRLLDEVLDMLAALAIGIILSATALGLLGALRLGHGLGESVGKIALCAIPAAIGALLAGKQLGGGMVREARPKAQAGYAGVLFTMLVGALFLAFNVAPTEEVALIAYQMSSAQSLTLVAASIALLHVLVYQLGFPGEDLRRGAISPLRCFLAFSAPGYAIALSISAFTLWAFGRFDGVSAHEANAMIIVLAFPAALGCATARLVI